MITRAKGAMAAKVLQCAVAVWAERIQQFARGIRACTLRAGVQVRAAVGECRTRLPMPDREELVMYTGKIPRRSPGIFPFLSSQGGFGLWLRSGAVLLDDPGQQRSYILVLMLPGQVGNRAGPRHPERAYQGPHQPPGDHMRD